MAGRKRKYESTKIKLNFTFEEALAILVNIQKQGVTLGSSNLELEQKNVESITPPESKAQTA